MEIEECTDFQVISGIGVKGSVNGVEVFAGGPTLLKHLGLIPLVHGSADGIIVYVIANRRLMGEE